MYYVLRITHYALRITLHSVVIAAMWQFNFGMRRKQIQENSMVPSTAQDILGGQKVLRRKIEGPHGAIF
jgi:hypothetical protein